MNNKFLKVGILIVFSITLMFSSYAYAWNAAEFQDIIYTVEKGDTLWGIGENFNIDYKIIASYNKIKNPDLINIGQIISIPKKNVDNIDLEFVFDSNVIGTWESVDFVENISDFRPGEKQFTGELYLRKLRFEKGGKLFFNDDSPKPYFTWTKGIVTHSEDNTASHYVIKKIENITYMFYEWKNANYVYGFEKPDYYVLKHIEETNNTKNEFTNDPEILGVWTTVDIVDDPSQFDGGIRKYRNAFYYKKFTFLRNGKMKLGDNPWVSWTKGFVIHSRLRVRNSYEIKKIGEYKYMFLEWNSGDTVNRNEKPYYYVLKHDK